MSDSGARLSANGREHVSNPPESAPLLYSYAPTITNLHGDSNELEEELEDMDMADITDQDVQSLMELSIGQAATRIKSAMTPAAERAAAMDLLEGGGLFDSDSETPPAGYYTKTNSGQHSPMYEPDEQAAELKSPFVGKENAGLSLGKLPSPKIENPQNTGIPITPWHVGPKSMVIQPHGGASHSSLAGALSNTRTRSMSGGADALKKFLEKGLPSMAQVGQMFGTSTGNHKSKAASSPTKDSFFSSHSKNSPVPSPLSGLAFRPQFESIVQPSTQVGKAGAPVGPKRPQALRRSTSDDSMLYHSLSRASSLGDDGRFENHREQVNSRVKAIRDTLQDRSSFRMPQMSLPSMPSMPRVPSFSFNMNFLTSSNTVPARWRSNSVTNVSGILPGTIAKRRTEPVLGGANPNPVVAPGVVSAAVTQPQTATAISRSIPDGQQTSYLDQALEHLTGDIVILGGYRGSILRSTQTNRRLWAPVKVGLNIRKVDLEVGLDPEDEETMPERIYPDGMLQHIGPIDVSRRLFTRLFECENARSGKLRVWDFGYDWRLSPALLSKKLEAFLEKLPSNQKPVDGSTVENSGAFVIAHSLGGLITRHVVNHRPELFSGVIYAGVPQSCINILGPLRNGDAVLFSTRVLTAQVNFTLRTSFVLLPEDGGCFIDINTKERYPVNFFDINDWIKYRLSPCTDPPLPPRNQTSSTGFGGLLKSGSLLNMSSAGRKTSVQIDGENSRPPTPNSATKTTRAADATKEAAADASGGTDRTLGFDMGGNSNPVNRGQSTNSSVSTAVTIPRAKALVYLERTLAETLKFKKELHFKPELSESNRYPPMAFIYGKNIPTCYGAKVDGKEGIPCSDSYENLAFASGDGVCLAKEAMLPPGYNVVSRGRIASDRGHITLLGDLNAVGRALSAVMRGRGKGIGLGDGVGVGPSKTSE